MKEPLESNRKTCPPAESASQVVQLNPLKSEFIVDASHVVQLSSERPDELDDSGETTLTVVELRADPDSEPNIRKAA
jgi:hypothetical protein